VTFFLVHYFSDGLRFIKISQFQLPTSWCSKSLVSDYQHPFSTPHSCVCLSINSWTFTLFFIYLFILVTRLFFILLHYILLRISKYILKGEFADVYFGIYSRRIAHLIHVTSSYSALMQWVCLLLLHHRIAIWFMLYFVVVRFSLSF
jgi:hypothetical protein